MLILEIVGLYIIFHLVFGCILFPSSVVFVSIFIALCVNAVTMQAQRTAPPDMVCKDKFLIQSTIVPVGTTDEDITPSMVCFCSFVVLYSIFWLLIDYFCSLSRIAASTLKRTSWEWPSLAHPIHQYCHQLMDYWNRGWLMKLQNWKKVKNWVEWKRIKRLEKLFLVDNIGLTLSHP